VDTPRPSPRTKWTRRVPHPVLSGHAAACARAGLPDIGLLFYNNILSFPLMFGSLLLSGELAEVCPLVCQVTASKRFAGIASFSSGRCRWRCIFSLSHLLCILSQVFKYPRLYDRDFQLFFVLSAMQVSVPPSCPTSSWFACMRFMMTTRNACNQTSSDPRGFSG
jgi:hypothetical protein